MNQNRQDRQANLIKIAAVVTATPRWVGALLAAEGFVMPDAWQDWWIVVSALLSAGMALVEGLAFSYVFNAWRVQKDKAAGRLLWLAMLSAAVFIAVLSPFIAAQVRQEALEAVLGTGWALWSWSASVAGSTIVIVASVGYAQKQKPATDTRTTGIRMESASRPARNCACWCGAAFEKQQQLAAHKRKHLREARAQASAPVALQWLRETYPQAWDDGSAPVTLPEVVEWRKGV